MRASVSAQVAFSLCLFLGLVVCVSLCVLVSFSVPALLASCFLPVLVTRCLALLEAWCLFSRLGSVWPVMCLPASLLAVAVGLCCACVVLLGPVGVVCALFFSSFFWSGTG